MKVKKHIFVPALTVLFAVLTSPARVSVPGIFADHMVIQQSCEVTVWGWADPGEKISVKGSWAPSEKVSAVTAADGTWRLKINTPKAGGPYTLVIQGSNEIVLKDILIGEVWICSGQSNMFLRMRSLRTEKSKNDIEKANFPQLRQFAVDKTYSNAPKDNCLGKWLVCSPETASSFSATAYYFGTNLYQHLNVPIGLVSTSWGATPVEAWTSRKALTQFGQFEDELKLLDNPVKAEDPSPKAADNSSKAFKSPSVLFNNMIHPLLDWRFKGVIWYQGEANRMRAVQYRTLFPAMIKDWREHWGQGDFPFYYVQIAPFAYGRPEGLDSAFLREAQMLAMDSLPNLGMAVTMDIGEEKNIHPKNKHDVGDRLARWALAKTYGKKDLAYSGPIYRSMRVEKDSIRLSFDYAGSGLTARNGPLTDFEIAGKDRKFVPAKATIDGKTIVVSAAEVSKPVAVRYAFKNWTQPNLYNAEGLPASSFRTDDWPVTR